MRRSNAKAQAFDRYTSPSKMDPPKLHFRPPAQISKRIVLISAASISIVFYVVFTFFRVLGSPDPPRFGIVIDGGSSGTRIHVYGYGDAGGLLVPVLDFDRSTSMKVGPGLSSYSEDPEAAGESLRELLEFGKEKVPREQWGETEVRLMATAGLRLVEEGTRERILESCRKVLRSSGFRFEDGWATVISGSDEGAYAWVAANYALGTLGDDPLKTSGIFELGGASAQVTFVSREPIPPEFSHVLKFGEATYNLYSHSFLHLGQDVAHESLRELLRSDDLKTSTRFVREDKYVDPCTPKGYLYGVEAVNLSSGALNSKTEYLPIAHAVGNFSQCRSAALMLLEKGKDKCLYSTCSLGSTFIPKLPERFIATENFYYTSKFFGLGSTSYLSELILAGENFCEEEWPMLKNKYPTLEEEELLRYCFSSAYIIALLHDSLGIAMDDTRIEFANQVGDVPLDWALGAFITVKMANQNAESSNWMVSILSADSSTYLSLAVVSLVIILTAWWSASKWRRPRLMTIYDLEKGRYILRRIKR